MELLLLEDDADLGKAVADHLAAAGHEVCWCHTLTAARREAGWAMALVDLNVPDGDGLTLLREWRASGMMAPVIVLTVRDQVSDRVRGLRAGADDYLVKPFDLDELLARVESVARRCALSTAPAASSQPRSLDLDLDLANQQATCDGKRVDLTRMEWAVLTCLAKHPGRIHSRSEIEGRLHDLGLAEAASNSLEVIVSRLRRKLGGKAISTHRGLGYRFEL
jgi:two-component system OmpR family response regulator